MNIYSDVRKDIIAILYDIKREWQLADSISFDSVIVEPPRDRSYGELATNAAMVVAKQAKQDPLVVAKFIEAKLQTATSSGDVYSMISVHRFEQRIVPRFCWFDLRLAESLYSMYGVPG